MLSKAVQYKNRLLKQEKKAVTNARKMCKKYNIEFSDLHKIVLEITLRCFFTDGCLPIFREIWENHIIALKSAMKKK
jgi:hypothetical protein